LLKGIQIYENEGIQIYENDKELFMKMKASKFVVVHAIHSLSPGVDEWLIKYNFHRPPTAHQKHLALGLPLDVPLRCKKNIIE
jgi:hypothetical protein